MAVEAAPDDLVLRVHFAELFAQTKDHGETVDRPLAALQRDPDNTRALRLIAGEVRRNGSDTHAGDAEPAESDVLRGWMPSARSAATPR